MRPRFLLLSLAPAILVLALAVAGCSSQDTASPAETNAPAETGGYVTVDVQTAYEALSSDEDAQLLDVREPEEWAETGVPEGAVLIPLGEVESRAAAELAPDKPVYVICRTGNRSITASETLVRLGFTEVYNVDGGVTAWLSAAQPVESYTP
jgi:rhodanese-related sulfurtransferase